MQALEVELPPEIGRWRDDVRRNAFDAADSAGHYWTKGNANREADAAALNVHHSFMLAAGSQQMPKKPFAFYESVSFRRVSCLINLPGHINRADPQLNGLVDRYHAHAYAQALLYDGAIFPNANGDLQFLPDDYHVKGENKR